MVRRVGTKMQGRKDGRVENKLFGKFVRTLGYILLALGLAIAAVTTIIALSGALGSAADNYAQYVEIMETKLQELAVPNIVFYGLAAVLVGLLLVILAVGRSWFDKIVHIVSFLFMVLYLIYAPENSILLLIGSDQTPQYITDFANGYTELFNQFNNLIAKYPDLMGGIVTAFYVIVALNVLGNKKPKRLSLSFVKAGLGIITFMVFAHGIFLPILSTYVEFVGDIMQSKYYLIAVYGSLTISYLFQLLGSVIGAIFFFVK